MAYDRDGRAGAREPSGGAKAPARGSSPGKRALATRLARRAPGGTPGSTDHGEQGAGSRDAVGAGFGSPVPPIDDGAGGAPLPHRQQMERAFGEDFSGLSVSLGAGSALGDIDASAATDGTSVAFASANPGPEEVAHELAHVVQHRRNGGGGDRDHSDEGDPAEAEAELVAGRVARGQDAGAVKERADALIHRRQRGATLHPQASPEVIRRYDAWVDGVYAAARRIVLANVQAVQAWRNYVLNQLSPRQMGGQVYGTAFQQIEGQAAANNAEFLLPYYAAEPNPIRQQLYEHQMAGEWRACTGCHVSNQAWALDGRMRAAGVRGVTPAELLSSHAGIPFSSGRNLDAGMFRDPGAWTAAFAPPAQPAQPAQPAHPTPAPLAPAAPAVDPERNREESLAAARRALLAIQPHLQPLGDAGYKIIPSNVISRFGQAPIEELRSAMEAAFARRLDGYQQLLGRIATQSIEYLEFDNLVAILKPLATPEVQGLIDDDKRRQERQEVIEFVGLLLLDLLSIVLPPVAIIAGIAHMAHGANQVAVGNDRNNATGLHGMMSPERQASGQLMMLGGTLEVMGGALQVAMATGSLMRAGGAGRVVATQRQGDITLELMENGTVRGTHAGYPGKSIVMNPDGSFQAFDELGNVVGTGAVGRGGGTSAAAQAWGTPGPAPGNTSLVPAAPSPNPNALAPRGGWPQISPFYTGGSGPGTLQPTQYNPSGRADNCGFSSMSYACSLQNPGQPLRDADQLDLERLQQLGFTVDDNLSRQLVFPERSWTGLRPRPGYGPLFDGEGGNRLADWTLPTTARSLGIPGTEANDALSRWQIAYGQHADVDAAVQARIEFLETHGNQCPNPTAVRRWIETARAELPGTYLVGSRSSAHYMTVTIDGNGQITGFDPQNGASYGSLAAVQARMGQGGFDLMYKITLPLPPTGAPPP
ncbi:MAG TPA: DUF4157 domain-containing protein [Kofleriaceae bacterium]|nr:DUF4157 domain-containing protein [Kofleriaceae bacterium]